MMEVLRSIQREYALVMKRAGSGVTLFRTKFQTQLWAQLAPLQRPKNRQECLELASAATLETVVVPIRFEIMTQLLSTFGDTKCRKRTSVLVDGTQYVVLPKDGSPVRITETDGLKGIQSENVALLKWIHSLIQVANNPHHSSC